MTPANYIASLKSLYGDQYASKNPIFIGSNPLLPFSKTALTIVPKQNFASPAIPNFDPNNPTNGLHHTQRINKPIVAPSQAQALQANYAANQANNPMSANNQTQGQRGRPQTNQVNPTGVDQNQVQLNSDMGVGTQTPTGAESGSPTSSKGFGNTPTSSKSATQHFKVSEFAFNTTESIVGDARGLTSQTDILTELYFGLTKGATSMTQNSTQNLIGNIVDVIYPQKVQNPIFIGSNQSPKSACSSSEVHKLITRRVKAKKSRGEKTGSDVRSEAEVKSDVSSTTMLKHSRPVREMSNVFLNSTLSSAELGVKASSLSDTLYRGAGRGVGLLGGGLVGSTLGGIGGNIAGSGLGAGIGTLLNHLQGNPYNLAPGEGAITGAQLGGALGNMAGTVGGGVLGGAKGYQMAGTYMDAKEKPKSKGQTDLSRSEDDKSRDELEAQWLKHHYEYDGKKPGKGPITARELD